MPRSTLNHCILTLGSRAAAAIAATAAEITDKQKAFVDCVLAQYVLQGVWTLKSCRRCCACDTRP